MHFDAVSLHVRSISVSNISEQLCDSVIDSIDMLLIKAQMSPGLYIETVMKRNPKRLCY